MLAIVESFLTLSAPRSLESTSRPFLVQYILPLRRITLLYIAFAGSIIRLLFLLRQELIPWFQRRQEGPSVIGHFLKLFFHGRVVVEVRRKKQRRTLKRGWYQFLKKGKQGIVICLLH